MDCKTTPEPVISGLGWVQLTLESPGRDAAERVARLREAAAARFPGAELTLTHRADELRVNGDLVARFEPVREKARTVVAITQTGIDIIGVPQVLGLVNAITRTGNDVRFTRLDLYADTSGILDADDVAFATEAREWRSRARSWRVVRSSTGTTSYIGNRDGPFLLRIYEKGKERAAHGQTEAAKRLAGVMRVELEAHRDLAHQLAVAIQGGETPGSVLRAALDGLLRYETRDPVQSRARSTTAPWWDRFLLWLGEGTTLPARGYETETPEERARRYLAHIAPTIALALGGDESDADAFLAELMEDGRRRLARRTPLPAPDSGAKAGEPTGGQGPEQSGSEAGAARSGLDRREPTATVGAAGAGR